MSKRKRVVVFSDEFEPPLKKVKLLSECERDKFLEGKKYQTFNLVSKKFEERDFGSISEEDDQLVLFGEDKMKTDEERLIFYEYFLQNETEFDPTVPTLPQSDSPPKNPKYKNFSDYSKHKINPGDLIFEYFRKGRTKCHWNILDSFEPGSEKKVVDLSKIAFQRWKDTQLTFDGDHTSGRESNRLKYIDKMLEVVVVDLKSDEIYEDVFTRTEEPIKGDVSGRVEYVLMCKTQIMLIVEAKRENLEAGLSQLIMEMRSACQQNTIELAYVYGFVSDARGWIPVRMKYTDTEKTIGIGGSCAIPGTYANVKRMTRSMEEVIFVMREMLQKGVTDCKSKTEM